MKKEMEGGNKKILERKEMMERGRVWGDNWRKWMKEAQKWKEGMKRRAKQNSGERKNGIGTDGRERRNKKDGRNEM